MDSEEVYRTGTSFKPPEMRRPVMMTAGALFHRDDVEVDTEGAG